MISVCMATYNGEAYLSTQVSSILEQLSSDDELIVVDDGSNDGSVAFLKNLDDPRIKIYAQDKNQGVKKSFKQALSLAQGEFIFLCDQDDQWLPGKVKKSLDAMQQESVQLVVHQVKFVDGNLKPLTKAPEIQNQNHTSFLKIFRRNRFIGATMCLRKSLLPSVVPFMEKAPMHDWWIALIASIQGDSICVLPDTLLLYRRHDSNVTSLKKDYNFTLKAVSYRLKLAALLFVWWLRK